MEGIENLEGELSKKRVYPDGKTREKSNLFVEVTGNKKIEFYSSKKEEEDVLLEQIKNNPVFVFLSERFKTDLKTKEELEEAIESVSRSTEYGFPLIPGLKDDYCAKNNIKKPDFYFEQKAEDTFAFFSVINGDKEAIERYWNFLHPKNRN